MKLPYLLARPLGTWEPCHPGTAGVSFHNQAPVQDMIDDFFFCSSDICVASVKEASQCPECMKHHRVLATFVISFVWDDLQIDAMETWDNL